MIVRRATETDVPLWAAMLARLHDDSTADEFEDELRRFTRLEQPYTGFLAFADDGEPIGLIDARFRNYAEAAPNLRAAYVEDLGSIRPTAAQESPRPCWPRSKNGRSRKAPTGSAPTRLPATRSAATGIGEWVSRKWNSSSSSASRSSG